MLEGDASTNDPPMPIVCIGIGLKMPVSLPVPASSSSSDISVCGCNEDDADDMDVRDNTWVAKQASRPRLMMHVDIEQPGAGIKRLAVMSHQGADMDISELPHKASVRLASAAYLDKVGVGDLFSYKKGIRV